MLNRCTLLICDWIRHHYGVNIQFTQVTSFINVKTVLLKAVEPGGVVQHFYNSVRFHRFEELTNSFIMNLYSTNELRRIVPENIVNTIRHLKKK